MKYWLFGVANVDNALQVFSDVQVDYQASKVLIDATGKDDIVYGHAVNDYLFAAGSNERIVSLKVAEIIRSLEGVFVWDLHVRLPHKTYIDTWKYIVIANHVDCIDFQRSTMKIREDGSIRNIGKLVLDEKKADLAGYHMFRLHEEFPRIVVSDYVKQAIEAINPVGIDFDPTDGSYGL